MPLEKPAKPPSLRQALGFFWSIPGVVLVGPAFGHLSFPEIVGAPFWGLVLGVAASWLLERKVFAERTE